MTWMPVFLIIWSVFYIGVVIWADHKRMSMRIAHEQRMIMIDWMGKQSNVVELHCLFSRVEFRDHIKEIFWNRDPYALYPAELISAYNSKNLGALH